jgi:Na+/H+ antiporter NhaD/arsenite permease-like protein
METFSLAYTLILVIFVLGYFVIVFEHVMKINKAAVALFTGVICWAAYFLASGEPIQQDLLRLGKHVSDIAQIIFFLMGSMALVELIDSHRGFKLITDLIQTTSKRKMLWLVSFITFFLSSILDNLTTTILMVSLLRKLIPHRQERFLLLCIVVVAANAGGAWTPIGDVTTTMLWINGQLSSLPVMKALFLPSLISLLIPLSIYTLRIKGNYPKPEIKLSESHPEPGARLVFILGVAGLVFVPIFKTWTGLPPFMGVMISLALLWLVTDLMHHKKIEVRAHLTVPHVLTRIDTSGILFFLGILLTISALESAHILHDVAHFLGSHISSLPVIATLIGIFSALIDNVPLVAATMGMYPLELYPLDASLWHMIAYAAGTGGSMLIIGSSSGVALMGLEKIDFISYLKKMTIPVFIGYLAGMVAYLLLI